ncbi:MAG: PD-(D/E)XK nuclease domain-containing protein [Candidatus Accumulibacter sp.]|nr:PD-(D/E)XK nuclease domain-containing protein [Accumulibacter sp.]
MLPPAERLRGAQLHRYVSDKLYWMLHAPRQTGKTTFLQSWMRELNARGDVVSCYVSVERAQGVSETERGMPAICAAIREYAEAMKLPVPAMPETEANSLLSAIMIDWAKLIAPKPLVVLFDETDVLQDQTLISFLRQLRGGFAMRGVGTFPTSIALVGMRDLKDYITASKSGIAPNPGSPFNIKQDSAVIGNFSAEDVARLFVLRTEETGQKITEDALAYVWDQSRGQPWIVNSLFMRATMRILDETSAETVTVGHIQKAREQMILARETHLDSLSYRLRDPRVRYVMETLLTGEPDVELAESDGFALCQDLGLVVVEQGVPKVANPIYAEILARQMTYGTQLAMPMPAFRWQKPDGALDMDALLREFQKFWRENSEIWEETANYAEAFPHLLLMAFLQRVTNGEGQLHREYAAGRGRMDLLVEYAGQSFIIEIKLLRDKRNPEKILETGLEQIRSYRDTLGADIPCYLLIFDRRSEDKKAPWDERIRWERHGEISVLRC